MVWRCVPARRETLGWRLIGLGEVPTPSRDESFEAVVLPHLDAAYNLARWLMRDSATAEDVVQEVATCADLLCGLQGRQSARLAAADRRGIHSGPRPGEFRADRRNSGTGVVAEDDLVSEADDPGGAIRARGERQVRG